MTAAAMPGAGRTRTVFGGGSFARPRAYRPNSRTGGRQRQWTPRDSGFDYRAAFGSNPWADQAGRISDLVESAFGSLGNRRRGSFSLGGTRTHVARPSDRAVQDHMSHVLAGQRNALDEYVKRAAGAGIKRGGLNVRGGPALRSSLHHSAMKNLAGGYEDRFRDAMNYNKYLKSTAYRQSQDASQNLQSLLGLQHQYLSSMAGRQNRLGSLMHSDWRQALDWKRNEPFRNIELQRARRRSDMEHWRNQWERTRERDALERRNALGNRWSSLQSRKDRAWNPAYGRELERLMVDTGVWQPLSRSRTTSFRL